MLRQQTAVIADYMLSTAQGSLVATADGPQHRLICMSVGSPENMLARYAEGSQLDSRLQNPTSALTQQPCVTTKFKE